jgi:hypothetical protein
LPAASVSLQTADAIGGRSGGIVKRPSRRFEYRDMAEGHGVYDRETLLVVACCISKPFAVGLVDLLNRCAPEDMDALLSEFAGRI